MNIYSPGLLQELANDLYLVFAIGLMLFIPIGQYFRWVGLIREKHRVPSLSLLLSLFGLTAIASYVLGWWISYAFTAGPGITGGFGDASSAWPWSDAMAPHVSQSGTADSLLHWVAFFLTSVLVTSLIAGPMLERAKGGAVLLLAVGAAGVFWPIASAWLWSPQSWMVKLVGFHDAFGAASVHTLAGGFALGTLVSLESRIAAYNGDNGVIAMQPPLPWAAACGSMIVSFGLLGLSLSTLSLGIASNGEQANSLVTMGAFGTPTTLGTVIVNFMMALAGGILSGHARHGGNLHCTAMGGIAGIVAVAAAADLYHPLQTFLIAAALTAVGLWWRDRLALKYGIDDVTGTIALHGIVGFLGVLLAGFILWTYPASSTADFARINPFGQLVGGVFALGLFGFLPGYLISRFLRFLGLLQQSPLSQLAGEGLMESLERFGIQRKAVERELSAAKLAQSEGDQ
jgi:ammonium transporter, Amt family